MKTVYERSGRRTIALKIAPDGTLVVRMPRNCPRAVADRFFREKRAWIEKTRERTAKLREAAPTLADGDLAAFAAAAKEKIPPLVAFYASELGVSVTGVKFRRMKSRWGSCSREGILTFNTLLGAAPDDVIRAVVVHELSHRIEMNHGPNFYATVENTLPDYKKSAVWLKTEGKALLFAVYPEGRN